MDEIEIYSRAIALWGKRAQTDMVIEECSELIKVLCKDKRGKVDIVEIIEEIVDVQIMLNQLKLILNEKDMYDRLMEYKLNRLQQKIEGY